MLPHHPTLRCCFNTPLRVRFFSMLLFLWTTVLALGISAPHCLGANVTSSGQFTTEIPIVVPPFHGLEPKLSLVYRSTPINGWIGAGWQLAGGASYIVRASTGRGAPRFDGSDIFLLDGMELVPCVSASASPSCASAVAAFGSSSGVYSTKIENFQRIQYVRASNSWLTWAKNGTQRVFRDNDGVHNSSGTCQWALRSETDTHGNQVNYTYDVDIDQQPPTVSELQWISYNTSISAGVSAIFFHSTQRPDILSFGTGQGIAQVTQRLQSIDVVSGSERVRLYALSYHTSASTLSSLLDKVQMFGRDAKINCGEVPGDPCDTSKPFGLVISGTSIPPMTFQYDETANATFGFPSTPKIGPSKDLIAGDFNGDGKTDYLHVNFTFDTYLSNGDGTFTLSNGTPLPPWCTNATAWGCFSDTSGSPVVIGDFNGDGKTDFIAAAQDLNAFLSNGDGTFSVVSSPPPAFCAGKSFSECMPAPIPGELGRFPAPHGHRPRVLVPGEIITGDFNGDGKTDFLVATDKFYTFLSNGDGTFRIVTWAPPSWCGGKASGCLSNQPNHIVVGDFDGDGKTDFMSANGNFDVFRSNGDGTFTWIPTPPPSSCTDGTTTSAALCINTSPYFANATIVGDFNGDGKTDFGCVQDNRHSYIFLSEGNGTFLLVDGATLPANLSQIPNQVILGDFNGAGKTEVMSANANFDVWLFTETGFQQVASTPPPVGWCATAADCINSDPRNRIIVGDFAGDGKTGFLSFPFSTIMVLPVGGPADHLISVSNSLGKTTTVFYAPSSTYQNTYLPVGSVFQTVKTVTTSDTATAVSDAHTYKYAGGLWDDGERRFLGFAVTTEVINAAGDYSQTFYVQTSACFSQPLERYLKDSTGLIYNFSVYSYLPSVGTAPYQCLLGLRWDSQAERLCSDSASCMQKGAREISTEFTYDIYGNLLKRIEHGDLSIQGDERTTQWTYSQNNSVYIVALPTEQKIFPGEDTSQPYVKRTTFAYDSSGVGTPPTIGDLTERVDYGTRGATPVTTTFLFDTYGNQTSATDANNHTTTKQFDQIYSLYPVQTCNPLGQCSTFAWDTTLGKMTSAKDANGATTTYAYDVLGRLAQLTNADGGTVKYTYQFTVNASAQPTGQSTRRTVSDDSNEGLWTDTYSDGLGRTYRTVRKDGYEKDLQYSDSTENVSGESGWYTLPTAPQWTRYSYDGARRLVTTTLPDASRRSTVYSIAKMTKLDELGQDTTFYIDAYGRKKRVQEHNGGNSYPTTLYAYDTLGDITQVQDAAGNYSLITWDMLGHKLYQADPDMGPSSYKYDAVGNVLSQTDANGKTINFNYDPLDRVLTKTYPDGSKVVRKYDEPGHGAGLARLTSITELLPGGRQKGSDSFSYDSMGRVTSSRKCRLKYCFTTNSAYDKTGRLSQLVYPDPSGKVSQNSETVTYNYDATGRLSSVRGHAPYVRATSYDPDGQISSIIYGNFVTGKFLYDPARRWLKSASVLGPGSPHPLYDATYQHDSAGHITTISSSSHQLLNLNFAYDALNRLSQVGGAQTEQFAYDDIGNITSNLAVGTYSYGVKQSCSPPAPCFTRPHAVTAAGNSTYSYDANGNMTSGAGRTITWNYDNYPVRVSTSSGTTSFEYDEGNHRVSRTEPSDSAPTYYFSSLVERTPSGDVVYSYYAGPMLVARRTASSSTVAWYHQDHLGSVRIITDEKGVILHSYDYAAFGTTLVPPSDPPDPYGFTGQLRNPSTTVSGGDVAGLIYMNARYYDASLGRFISADSIIPDPMNPQSLNRYSYVLNNPVCLNDPTGHGMNEHPPFVLNGSDLVWINWVNPDPPGEVFWADASSAGIKVNPFPQVQCPLCTTGFGPFEPPPPLPDGRGGGNFSPAPWVDYSPGNIPCFGVVNYCGALPWHDYTPNINFQALSHLLDGPLRLQPQPELQPTISADNGFRLPNAQAVMDLRGQGYIPELVGLQLSSVDVNWASKFINKYFGPAAQAANPTYSGLGPGCKQDPTVMCQ
jgi:RHS repeat-associated protein